MHKTKQNEDLYFTILNKSDARARNEPIEAQKIECMRLGALIFMPSDRGGEQKKRFVSVKALDQAMIEAFDQFGFDIVRDFYRQVKEARKLGKLIFDPNRLTEYLQGIRDGETLFPNEILKERRSAGWHWDGE